jgi:NodT family efflux transporter outer membrane factor (OMF) lipoprotein
MMPRMPNRLPRSLTTVLSLAAFGAASLSGCAVGPNYVRPKVEAAPAYKEQAAPGGEGWNQAKPGDLAPRGDWWTVFNDPTLDALEARVAISNQNVAAAEAAYRQSEAIVREQRAALFPTVTLNGGVTRSGSGGRSGGTVVSTGGNTSVVNGGGRSSTNYRTNVGASWEPDLWGRIRRSIESARGQAQASQADLAGALLSAQGALASDYFNLRQSDVGVAVLEEIVDAYQKSYKIADNRYRAGTAPHSDVLQAQSLLASAQANLADVKGARATFEHAIAVLMGETPEAFTLPPDPNWTPIDPQVPVGVPSTLLQRRPDVAAAERRAAAASAQIGVAVAAYFPDITLTGSYGFAATELGSLFTTSSSVWSAGASAAEALFEGGARRAQVSQARAGYDQAVAQYRQTALAAFQDVEDQLALSRSLADEYVLLQSASSDADQAQTMVTNQYREGQVAYDSVVVAQVAAFNAKRTLVQTGAQRLTTTVALIQALGGGWTAPF